MIDTKEKLMRLFMATEDMRLLRMGVSECVDHLIACGVTIQEQVGCEFCIRAKWISGAFTASGYADKDHMFNVNMDGDVNFCPMCGRKLPEPQRRA